MDNFNVTKTAYKKANMIIDARLEGKNKQESRLHAGYSPAMSKTNFPEQTKAYAVAINERLVENNYKMLQVSQELSRKILRGDLEQLPVKDLVDIHLKMAHIHKILTPQVTVKEEKDKDGNTKITKWGTTGVQPTFREPYSEDYNSAEEPQDDTQEEIEE